MASRISLLIGHRNRLVTECLAYTLEKALGHECQVIHLGGKSLRDQVSGYRPDVLLADLELATSISDSLIETVRRLNRDCKLLFLIAATSMDRITDLIEIGSNGCIIEDASLDELEEAIRTVVSHGSYCSPQLANALYAQLGQLDIQHDWAKHMDNVQLTSREREILELIAWERLGNKQIARRLRISVYTVKNHVHNVIDKLGAQDRHEAAGLATRRRMLVSKAR